MTKYLTVRYREGDLSTYTYAYPDEADPKPGDSVLVDARGRSLLATIVEVDTGPPTRFPVDRVKPITELLGPVGAAENSGVDPSSEMDDDEIPY